MRLLRRRALVPLVPLALAVVLAAGAAGTSGCGTADTLLVPSVLERGDWVLGFLEFDILRPSRENALKLTFYGRNHTWLNRFTRFRVIVRRLDGEGAWRVVDERLGRQGEREFKYSRTLPHLPRTAAVGVSLEVWLDGNRLTTEEILLGRRGIRRAGPGPLPPARTHNTAHTRPPEADETPEPTPTVPPPVGRVRETAEPFELGLPEPTVPPGPPSPRPEP